GPTGPREVDRRRFGLGAGVDVEALALGHPFPGLERPDEAVLRGPGLLLERDPRDLGGPRGERTAYDIGLPPALPGIDAVGDVLVDLHAARREPHHRRERGSGHEEDEDCGQCDHTATWAHPGPPFSSGER